MLINKKNCTNFFLILLIMKEVIIVNASESTSNFTYATYISYSINTYKVYQSPIFYLYM